MNAFSSPLFLSNTTICIRNKRYNTNRGSNGSGISNIGNRYISHAYTSMKQRNIVYNVYNMAIDCIELD